MYPAAAAAGLESRPPTPAVLTKFVVGVPIKLAMVAACCRLKSVGLTNTKGCWGTRPGTSTMGLLPGVINCEVVGSRMVGISEGVGGWEGAVAVAAAMAAAACWAASTVGC